MISTLEPSAVQNAFSLSTAAASVPGSRRQDATSGRRTARRSRPRGPTARCRRSDGRARNARPAARAGPVAHDRRLHRADVGQDGAGAQMRRDLRRERPAGADRHAEDDEVGALHGLGRAGVALVDEAELQRRVERRLGARAADDRLGEPLRRMAWLIEEPIRPMPISATRSNIGLRHAGRPPRKSASAATTARLSASVPMVMRRQSGRP